MRARRTSPPRGCAHSGGGAPTGPRPAVPRQEPPPPVLRYRLEVTYEVLPGCEEAALEDALDRVSAELHPQDVELCSVPGGVLVVLEVEHDDVLEVYGRVAVALGRVVVALRRHWPHGPDDGGEPRVLLLAASQSFS